MNSLETHPDFNPDVKIKDIDSEKSSEASKINMQASNASERESVPGSQEHDKSKAHDAPGDTEEDDLGFSLFQQVTESADKPKGKQSFFLGN